MKRIAPIVLSLALMTSLASFASANTSTPRIDRREWRQHHRIAQGVRSHELTRREAMRLERGQARVHRMERRSKRDGYVSGRERARMTHMQNRQSRRIYRLKHNHRV